MLIRAYPRSRVLLGVVAIAALLVLPAGLPGSYEQYVLNLIGVYTVVALGLVILTGYTSQISLGHAAFFALGAYAAALVEGKLHVPFWAALPLSGVAVAILGALVGLPALRLRGLSLAIATMAFGMMVEEFLVKFRTVTNGANGMAVVRPLWGDEPMSDRQFYYVILAVVALSFLATINFVRMRTGRAFAAIRDSETAAETMGINLAVYKVMAFSISALYTGLAGALYAHLVGFITPVNFGLFLSIGFLTMIVVGGANSLAGAVLGAVFMTGVPELFRGALDYQMAVYGIAMILVMIFLPTGLAGLPARLSVLLAGKRRPRTVAPQAGSPNTPGRGT